MKLIIILGFLLALTCAQSTEPIITVNNTDILASDESVTVFKNGKLNDVYDDTIYNGIFNCENGYLNIINNTNGDRITFLYAGFGPITSENS
jgi:hypothetical protein